MLSLGMISTIVSFLTGLGGTVRSVSSDIARVKEAQAKAQSDERIQELKREENELHDRREVLVAEARRRFGVAINASTRAALALGPTLYILKRIGWDKVVGSAYGCAGPSRLFAPFASEAEKIASCWSFRTDGLSVEMAAVVSVVIGFYFVHQMRK